jgi:hypothetical protein
MKEVRTARAQPQAESIMIIPCLLLVEGAIASQIGKVGVSAHCRVCTRDRADQFCELSASPSHGTKPGQSPLPPCGTLALQPGPPGSPISANRGRGRGRVPDSGQIGEPGRGRGSVPAPGQIGDGRPVPVRVPGQIGDGDVDGDPRRGPGVSAPCSKSTQRALLVSPVTGRICRAGGPPG